MAATMIWICDKCSRSTHNPKTDGWAIHSHQDAGVSVPLGTMVIRCPNHPIPADADLWGYD